MRNLHLGVTAVPNGNLIVTRDSSSNGLVNQVGDVTWGNGSRFCSGAVSLAHSIVGATISDFVGLNGVLVLANGNYAVNSPLWDNGAVLDAGASHIAPATREPSLAS
jgi:hypothetical protein